MTHWPYIAVCYGLGLAVPLAFAVMAWHRLNDARRRLAAVDPRSGA